MKTATEAKPWRSGWCNPSNPVTSHRQCERHPRPDGVPCCCICHIETMVDPVAPDQYDALVERVAVRRAARTYRDTPWAALTEPQRRHHLAEARVEVDLVTAELRTWEA